MTLTVEANLTIPADNFSPPRREHFKTLETHPKPCIPLVTKCSFSLRHLLVLGVDRFNIQGRMNHRREK